MRRNEVSPFGENVGCGKKKFLFQALWLFALSAALGSGRQPKRRGPVKQFTDSVDASVTKDVARRLQSAANRRGISRAGLMRQIFAEWLKANEEAGA